MVLRQAGARLCVGADTLLPAGRALRAVLQARSKYSRGLLAVDQNSLSLDFMSLGTGWNSHEEPAHTAIW